MGCYFGAELGLAPAFHVTRVRAEDTCVAYLIDSLYNRPGADVGLAPVSRFLESYVTHDGGVSHRLLVLRRGFRTAQTWAPYASEFNKRGVTYDILDLPRSGRDLGAYRQAVKSLPADAYCFLNTSSEILGGSWLTHLLRAAHSTAAGLVGATGSLESAYSRRVSEYDPPRQTGNVLASVRHWIGTRRRRHDYLPFPNPHIRTNAFMVRRMVAVELHWGPLRSRYDALRCESGRSSLSQQTKALGLRNLIVGRDGQSHEEDEWGRSCTFRCGEQSNLLIADNRTREYQFGSNEERARLAQIAWGYPFHG